MAQLGNLIVTGTSRFLNEIKAKQVTIKGGDLTVQTDYADGITLYDSNQTKMVSIGPDGTFSCSSTWDGTNVGLKTALANKLSLSGGKMTGDISWEPTAGQSKGLYWKESGYGDKFRIYPEFNGTGESNGLKIAAATGEAGTDPTLVDQIKFTPTGGIEKVTASPSGWHKARDNAFIRSHSYANAGSLYGAVSMLTQNGSWCIGVIGNRNALYFSWTRNTEYTNNENKTNQYYISPANDGVAADYAIIHTGNIMNYRETMQVPKMYSDSYPTLLPPNGTNNWIKIGTANTNYGIIPSQAGAIGAGHNSIGTSTWYWYCSYVTHGFFNIVYANNSIRATTSESGTLTTLDLVSTAINCFSNHKKSTYSDITARTFIKSSSQRIKENIKDITDDEAKKILNIRPVSFDYKKEIGGQKNQFGVIAEEAIKVLPHTVTISDSYDKTKPIGCDNPAPGVDYSSFVPHLIKMIQIQQKEIDELKSKL